MPEEKPEVEKAEENENTYYDDVRADIETCVYALSSLEEVDTALFSKGMTAKVKKAKEDCVYIICKGMETLRNGYEED